MSSPWLFLGLVFFAVLLLVQGMVVPVFGESTRMRKRLLSRLNTVTSGTQGDFASLLREKSLKELSGPERALEMLPGMERLARVIEQSGRAIPAYRLVLLSLAFGILGGLGLVLDSGTAVGCHRRAASASSPTHKGYAGSCGSAREV